MTQCFSKSRLPPHSVTKEECYKLTNNLSNKLLKILGTDISALSFHPAGLHTNLKSQVCIFNSEISVLLTGIEVER